MRGYDWLVVGAGFAGAVLAERLAAIGSTVLVIDRRAHIAGNAYDELNADGVRIHRYGPHIFHTNSAAVFEYLSRFTGWRAYEHRVLASVDGKLAAIPINQRTIETLYGLRLDEREMQDWLARRAAPLREVKTAEDAVVSKVGWELYEKFFKHYTLKQWGIAPTELDASVTARIPVRTNDDDRYFTDTFQFMPVDGYTAMFARMLDHPRITLALGMDLHALPPTLQYRRMVYTGPIDEYFGCCFGKLPYRSLRFEHVSLAQELHQPVGTINYPQDKPYTRVSEYKHMTGQIHPKTALTYEFPTEAGDPYYPVPRERNTALYKRYAELAARQSAVVFVGRLATYRYLNMDQVVAQALATFARIEDRGRSWKQAAATAPGNVT